VSKLVTTIPEPWASCPLPEAPVEPLHWTGTWRDGRVSILDQTRLPREETFLDHRHARGVIDDIRRLAVRGAPIIGVAGAYAVVLAAREIIEGSSGIDVPAFWERMERAGATIGAARPTAVNLPAAVTRCLAAGKRCAGSPEQIVDALLDAARRLETYEREACASIARRGAAWLSGRTRFLTHCNAGALVAPGLGTALAPFYALHAAKQPVHVWVDETRPLLQGLRLTAYELGKAGISHEVLADSAAAGLFRKGLVDAVVVGADRICANGDVVNKVGTFSVALAAKHHEVPFVVAAPRTTIDMDTAAGDDVVIEGRPDDAGLYLDPAALPANVTMHAPAFDVTPAELVTALVTDAGVLEAPSRDGLGAWKADAPV